MSDWKYPRVGTAVWIRREGRVLLGKRIKGWLAGSWCPPGGGLELFEEPETGALREVQEETGLSFESVRFLSWINDVAKDSGRHWLTMYFVADWKEGNPREAVGEIGEWTWYEWDKLPDPLFLPTRNFVESGYNPFTK